MFPLALPILIGAGGGALMNKKNPLAGALMGGALGGVGGGLLGAGGAATQQAQMLAAQEAGLGPLGSLGWGGATTGAQGMINSATSGGLLDTAGNAMKTASTVKSLMPEDRPMPAAPQYTSGGNNSMASFYNNLQGRRDAQFQNAQDERMRRLKLLNRIG